ncbi:MAG: cardiolipin synthase B [Proteobacteria bacterium]|nr:cardiolipin synthase B [Pseudomonadota bacterium]
MSNAPPPTVVGAHGPLSPERSKEILAKLAADSPNSGALERHLALEQAFSETPLVAGNDVQLIADGQKTYDEMFAAIAAARDHINMETYILEDDDTGKRFADALIAKQRAGVQVNLIRDAVGTIGTPNAFFDRLKEAGIRIVVFNPVNPLEAKAGWDVNQRDHRKLLVIDGKVAFLGGINISAVYSGGSFGSRLSMSSGGETKKKNPKPADLLPWKDTDVRIAGPVVAELQKLFMQTWNDQHGEPLTDRNYFPQLQKSGNEVVHAMGSVPADSFSPIYATLISAIDNAETEILITNAYFVPDPQFTKSLIGAARRGVKVTLILPSQSDSSLVLNAGRSYYGDLLEGGVQIYERKGAILHSKTVLIDGVWSTVGSTNLDWRSFLHNQEINAVILGTEFGDEMRAAFQNDLAQSSQITLEAWRSRSIGDRLKQGFGRLWQYWL